jgi:hypothetical protein
MEDAGRLWIYDWYPHGSKHVRCGVHHVGERSICCGTVTVIESMPCDTDLVVMVQNLFQHLFTNLDFYLDHGSIDAPRRRTERNHRNVNSRCLRLHCAKLQDCLTRLGSGTCTNQ